MLHSCEELVGICLNLSERLNVTFQLIFQRTFHDCIALGCGMVITAQTYSENLHQKEDLWKVCSLTKKGGKLKVVDKDDVVEKEIYAAKMEQNTLHEDNRKDGFRHLRNWPDSAHCRLQGRNYKLIWKTSLRREHVWVNLVLHGYFETVSLRFV